MLLWLAMAYKQKVMALDGHTQNADGVPIGDAKGSFIANGAVYEGRWDGGRPAGEGSFSCPLTHSFSMHANWQKPTAEDFEDYAGRLAPNYCWPVDPEAGVTIRGPNGQRHYKCSYDEALNNIILTASDTESAAQTCFPSELKGPPLVDGGQVNANGGAYRMLTLTLTITLTLALTLILTLTLTLTLALTLDLQLTLTLP